MAGMWIETVIRVTSQLFTPAKVIVGQDLKSIDSRGATAIIFESQIKILCVFRGYFTIRHPIQKRKALARQESHDRLMKLSLLRAVWLPLWVIIHIYWSLA